MYKILFYLFFWKKWLTIFQKVLTPFRKQFLWNKQLFDAKILIKRLLSLIVNCSKNYGSPTSVTKSKFASNIAIPIRPNENDCTLKVSHLYNMISLSISYWLCWIFILFFFFPFKNATFYNFLYMTVCYQRYPTPKRNLRYL